MGQLQPIVDPSGATSATDINNQNISQMIDEMNRMDDQMSGGVGRTVNGVDFYYNKVGQNYLQIGALTDGSYGVAFLNTAGKVISENNGATEFKYDANGINYQQNGLLPDGTYGFAIAAPRHNVSEGYA